MSAIDDRVPRAALQRESAMVNDLCGVKAFCIGALHEVLLCTTLEDAKTCAEMALGDLAEHVVGGDPVRLVDPADWRRR